VKIHRVTFLIVTENHVTADELNESLNTLDLVRDGKAVAASEYEHAVLLAETPTADLPVDEKGRFEADDAAIESWTDEADNLITVHMGDGPGWTGPFDEIPANGLQRFNR